MKKIFIAAALALICTATAFANETYIVWVKAEVYPTGAGTVYTDFGKESEEKKDYAATSEFKRTEPVSTSDAFIWAKPAEGYMLAGYARDNGNQIYDRDADLQVKVRDDGYFTAIYDHNSFKGNSTTEATELAEEALSQMTTPTDYIFAVFTKGVVARVAEDQIGCGNAYADKLYTEPGDQVTLTAYGDSRSDYGTEYFKFDHWTDSSGNTVGTEREMTVTVSGPEIYYAHFVETDKEDYKANENDPHKSEDYYNGGVPGATAIQHVSLPTQQDNRVYDLQGSYVANPTHGIFIQNGKKIVVR